MTAHTEAVADRHGPPSTAEHADLALTERANPAGEEDR